MFRNLFRKLWSWLREIWSLFKTIDGAVSKESQSKIITPTNTRSNALTPTSSLSYQSPAIRHRYVELEGYAENLRIDSKGRYDLRQLARFAENFVWISPDSIDEFITGGMDYDTDYIDGQRVLWLDKTECIEWSYLQYSPLSDLL
ncbi:hypothetical protein swp_3233 [Shewanella piezotolerans WP3]|uniref:Uncharacterized protein n=1 Tax=Shewanella piezotolerans (strain WP3 / JCM 13877) TaxID=225849 RepID=B8CRD1_SHEPW|nr:hypothetical protein [Shewanella piezotolerans]ACJ29939.1 hypothetical protein swp_3233 [Shewanella piezotolerans WP3]